MATATATTNQTVAPAVTGSIEPAALVVTSPAAEDVTILTRDNGALVDLRAVLNEPITFTRIGGDLQMVFETGGTVVIQGFFSGSGEAAAVLVADEGTATLSLDQFSSISGIAGTEELQTAAGAPVTLGDQVNQPEGSSQSFEDPGLAGLGDGLGTLDLLGSGDQLSTEILLPEDLLPGLDADAEDATFLASLDDGTEEPIEEEPVDEEPVGNLYLWIDQLSFSAPDDIRYLDIHEFEDLTIQINGDTVDFSLEETLSNGVNELENADPDDLALDGVDTDSAREMFLNLGDVSNLPDSGEIRLDFNYANFDIRKRATSEDDAIGGVEDGEGYRVGLQIGDDDGAERETVVDHTDNGIAFENTESTTPTDFDDSPRTIKFDYEITEDGEINITDVLTIFRGGLVIDTDGGGIEMNGSINFDMDSDGTEEEIGWLGVGDGLLVVDIDGNGTIDHSGEVIGQHFDATSIGAGSTGDRGHARYHTGAQEALKSLDSNALFDPNGNPVGNNDGVLDQNDLGYHLVQVMVAVDTDNDGIVDSYELKSLADLGITSIDLNSFYQDQDSKYDESWEDVNDNIIDREGSFTTDSGIGAIYEMRFWESEPAPGSTDTVTTGASDVLSSLADADLFSDILQTTSLDLADVLESAFPTPVIDQNTAENQTDLPDTSTGADMMFDMQSMGETVQMVMDMPDADAALAGQPG
ncbi:hypothetical protein [Roseibium sp.]|uniref:hypothetical protein n=1 Tax=Roseibium sp. TaxID=1936156 RepID=UPI003B510BD5